MAARVWHQIPYEHWSMGLYYWFISEFTPEGSAAFCGSTQHLQGVTQFSTFQWVAQFSTLRWVTQFCTWNLNPSKEDGRSSCRKLGSCGLHLERRDLKLLSFSSGIHLEERKLGNQFATPCSGDSMGKTG